MGPASVRRIILLAGAAGSLVTAGCSDSAAPPPGVILQVSAGDGQSGYASTPLGEPLEVSVLDAADAPQAGVAVTWQPVGDGGVTPGRSVTDAAGLAQAAWTLGSTRGTVTLEARTDAGGTVTFHAENLGPLMGPPHDLTPLALNTFDHSGQVVHPDFARTPAGLMGFPSHLAITPYPGGDADYERPSIFASGGSLPWSLEPGAPNPVATAGAGYLSDPDLVFLPDRQELWLYYRQVTSRNVIHLRRSPDAVHWGPEETVLAAPNHQIISPAVVYRGPDDWRMWSVNAGGAGCTAASTTVDLRTSTDGLHWSSPTPVELGSPAGVSPWHLDVQWIPSREEYWALYNAKSAGGCVTSVLFLATSSDGIQWHTLPQPVLQKGIYPAFQDVVYRSTFEYDPAADAITFWFSGARYENGRYIWSAAVLNQPRATVWQVPAGAGSLEPAPYRDSPPPAPFVDWP